jgi:hypothetical protein
MKTVDQKEEEIKKQCLVFEKCKELFSHYQEEKEVLYLQNSKLKE